MSSRKEELIGHICHWFKEQELSLSLAESCTGGLVSSWVAEQPGVSSFFKGAIVSYAREVKISVLGVSEQNILKFGEVSAEVADEMAKGVRQKLKSDWSVSITGIAGPTGGTETKPVGTVCFGVCGPDFEKSVRMNFEEKQRTLLQEESALFALDLLWQSLPHKSNKEDFYGNINARKL